MEFAGFRVSGSVLVWMGCGEVGLDAWEVVRRMRAAVGAWLKVVGFSIGFWAWDSGLRVWVWGFRTD